MLVESTWTRGTRPNNSRYLSHHCDSADAARSTEESKSAQPWVIMYEFNIAGVFNVSHSANSAVYSQGQLFLSSGRVVNEVDTQASTSKCIAMLETSVIKSFDISAKRNFLVMLGECGTLFVRNVTTGLQVQTNLKRTPDAVKFISNNKRFWPDIMLIFNNGIEVWRMADHNPMKPLTKVFRETIADGAGVSFGSHSPDGAFALLLGQSCRLYRDNGREYTMDTLNADSDIVGVGFRSEEEMLTLSSCGVLCEWVCRMDDQSLQGQVHVTKRTQLFEGVEINCSCFGANAQRLGVVTSSNRLEVYDTARMQKLSSLNCTFQVKKCVLGETGEEIILLGKERVMIWEIRSQTLTLDRSNTAKAASCIALSNDGSALLVGTQCGIVNLWNVSTCSCLATFGEHKNIVSAVQFLSSGSGFVSASFDGTIRAYDIFRFRNFRVFTSSFQSRFNHVAIDSTDEILCATTIDTCQILLWSFKTGQLLDVLSGHAAQISSLHFFSTTSVVSGAWDRTVRVWNIHQREGIPQVLVHNREVLAVAVNSRENEVAVSTVGQKISLWKLESGYEKLLGTIDYARDISGTKPSEQNNFVSLQFDLTSSTLLGCTSKGLVCVYDHDGLALLHRLNPHSIHESDPRMLNEYVGQLAYAKEVEMWSMMTTEGVYVYQRAPRQSSQSHQLKEDATLSNLLAAWRRQDFKVALQLGLSLKERVSLLKAMLYNIPVKQQRMLLRSMQAESWHLLVANFVELVSESVHLEYLLVTILSILLNVEQASKDVRATLLRKISVQMREKQTMLEKITSSNLGAMNFICCVAHN